MTDRKKSHLEPSSHAPSKSVGSPQATPPRERPKSSPSEAACVPVQPLSSTHERSVNTRLLTLKETAARLAISLPTIRSWVWQRKIEIVKIGRCVRVREQAILDLIARNTVAPRSTPQKL
jgi:excisionase family DNA binding protein